VGGIFEWDEGNEFDEPSKGLCISEEFEEFLGSRANFFGLSDFIE
jgi:hypothetical protein